MNLASIPAHLPFLDSLARRWLGGLDPRTPDADGGGAGTILLPPRPPAAAGGGAATSLRPPRRAARALAEAFLRATDGRVLLLPRIIAIGALDEAPLALAGSLDLPPAVAPMRRLAELSRLVLAASGGLGIAPVADQAWLLSRSLAELMDEAERNETDLAERLPRLAETHAEHWQITLRFLQIVTQAWPAWLGENGLMNPAAREAALLPWRRPGASRRLPTRYGRQDSAWRARRCGRCWRRWRNCRAGRWCSRASTVRSTRPASRRCRSRMRNSV